MIRTWHRKGQTQLPQLLQLVRDPLYIRDGPITRAEAKKIKVEDKLLMFQEGLKNVKHDLYESSTSSRGVTIDWRSETRLVEPKNSHPG